MLFVFSFQILFVGESSASNVNTYSKSQLYKQALVHKELFAISDDPLDADVTAYKISFGELNVDVEHMHGDGSSFRIDGALISINLDESDEHNAFYIAELLANRFPKKFAFQSPMEKVSYSWIEKISESIFPTAHAGMGALIIAALVVAAIVIVATKSKKKSSSSKNASNSTATKPKKKKEDIAYNLGKGDYFAEKKGGTGEHRTYSLPSNPSAKDCQKAARYYHDWAKKGYNINKSDFSC